MTTEAVVIVGAGAAGATMALLLARYGIPSTIVDQRTQTRLHPAAHVINARTLEIWKEASPELVSVLERLIPPIDTVNIIRWCTEIHGLPLGEIDLLCAPDLLTVVRSHSPFLISHIGQHLLMPALWDALDREELVDFRRGWQADMTGRTLTLQPSGAPPVAHAPRYVIAADGAGSGLRHAAGIAMSGPILANMGSVFFHARDLYPAGHNRPLLSWIYHPRFSGVMIAHADDDYVLMTPYLHPAQLIARDSHKFWDGVLPEVIGTANYQIRSTGTWTMTSQMAATFRRDSMLLIGDAAHRFPHTGGFGLNSGVQDAHNLAWKLAAIIRHGAPDTLLNTYEIERRPVVARFAEQSAMNHFKLDEVTKPLGISNRSLHHATTLMAKPWTRRVPARILATVADGLTQAQTSRTKRLLRNDARSERLRRRMAERIPFQLEHFVATGLEFGYSYISPLVDTVSEGPCPNGDVAFYRPTTHPGARLPHMLVRDRDETIKPIHEMVQQDSLTLFTADPAPWSAAVKRCAIAVVVTVVALAAPTPEDRAAMIELFEVGERGAVVVRPDGHVVWRSRTNIGAAEELRRFLATAWAGIYPVDATSAQHETDVADHQVAGTAHGSD